MKKGQRPSAHWRNVKTKFGRILKRINPFIKKKNYGADITEKFAQKVDISSLTEPEIKTLRRRYQSRVPDIGPAQAFQQTYHISRYTLPEQEVGRLIGPEGPTREIKMQQTPVYEIPQYSQKEAEEVLSKMRVPIKKSYENYPQKIHLLSKEIDRAPDGSLTRFFKAEEIKQIKKEQREKQIEMEQ